MVTLVFIRPSGDRVKVEGEVGASIMETAVNAQIDEIYAECGGQCVCGTCHAYIDSARFEELKSPEPMEQELLEGVLEQMPNSRLTCQLKITDDMEGLEIQLPERQY